jgi:hypothetical protein
MIACLMVMLILINLSLFFTLLTKKKIDNMFIVSILSITVLLYLFGLFKGLKIGVYAVYTVSIYAFFMNLFWIFKKKRFKKELVLTNGLFAFIFVFAFLVFIHRGRMLSNWDEFSHWGYVVKAIFNINDFQTNPLSLCMFKSYPPTMSLFQYFFMNVGGYSESYLYIAYNLFGFCCFLPFLQKIKKRSNYILCLVAFLLLPLIFYDNYYYAIYIDAMVGIVFAYSVYLVDHPDDKYDLLFLFLAVFSLTLLKDVGLFFSIIIAILLAIKMLIDIIKNKKKFKRYNLISLVVVIIAILISKVSWNIMININDVVPMFGQKISLKDIYNLITHSFTDYRANVIGNYHKALYSKNIINTFINLDFIRISIIYVIAFVYLYKKKLVEKNKAIVLISGLFIYCFGLLVLYCFRFSEYEALLLSGYERYLSIALLGLLIIIFVYYMKQEKNIIVIFFITLLFVPYSSLFNIRWYANDSALLREPYNIAGDYIKSKTDEDEKIYLISQNTNGFDYFILKYTIWPNETNANFTWSIGQKYNDGDVWTEYFDSSSWMEYLINEKFDYVYIYKSDDQFINQFKNLFEDTSQIESGKLYKLDVDKKLLTVVN